MPVFRLVRSAVFAALRLANASPTSEAVNALLAVNVNPFTLTDSPCAMALKVRVDVEAAPVMLLAGSGTTPWLKTLVGVGPLPFDNSKLNATPPLSCVVGKAKPELSAPEMLRCALAKLVMLTEWLPVLAVAVVITDIAELWLTRVVIALKSL